jgi:hypothetical protein
MTFGIGVGIGIGVDFHEQGTVPSTSMLLEPHFDTDTDPEPALGRVRISLIRKEFTSFCGRDILSILRTACT